MPADRVLEVLVVGSDPSLEGEVERALGAVTSRAALRSAADFGSGLVAVRSRRPDAVFTELGTSPEALRDFAAGLRALAPGALLIAVRSGPADDAEGPILVEAVRVRIDALLERPLSSRELQRIVPRLEEILRGEAGSGRIVAFHSTKGGVGKSTLSINTACGLARSHPDQVLLVDCSLQLGVCAAALDLQGSATLADAVREHDRLDPTLLRQLAEPHPSGLRLLSAPIDAVDASDVTEDGLTRLLAIAREAFEFVVVDTLPVVDGFMLAVLDLADRVYLVNQGTVPDVIGAARLLAVLDELGIHEGRRRVVLNRNTPRFSGSLRAIEVATRLGCAVDFEVPYDKRVFTALNLGRPRILSAGRFGGWGRVVRAITRDAEAVARSETPSAAPRDEVAQSPAMGAVEAQA